MKILLISLLSLSSLLSLAAEKSETAAATQVAETVPTCESFQVFKSTVDYLKTQKELPFTEPQILKAALDINKGCDGADKRFKKIFELLSRSGVSIKKCYELAVEFSHMNDQKTDNFTILFKGLFLDNKFDLDFMTAYKVSLQLSAALPKDWEKVQKDFSSFLDYCATSKSEELPIKICAEWTLSLLKHQSLYKDGLYPSFTLLNDYLLKRAGPQVPVKDRLNLITEVISYGPKAPSNFQKALEWLGSSKGAGLQPAKAHRLALEIAKNSLKPPEPTMAAEKIENP